MVEEVLPRIFRMEIPLPNNPLKAINSYLIKGEGRFLIVDTGMNRRECLETMQLFLKELKVDLKETDFFITHLHADHLGLVSELAAESSKIYFNHPDAEAFKIIGFWDKMMNSALINGFPEAELKDAILQHPGRKYFARGPLNFTLLQEGDNIGIGDYSFLCVETPGHTKGHMCLYDPKSKILFSGDHILGSITPNIALWLENEDPLQQYMESLDKIDKFDIAKVLPGHRRPFHHHHRRIFELKKHHAQRTDEVLSILRDREQTAYQVASRMTWDIRYDRWEDFPIPQKWFAAGEALAHLQYLQGKGQITRELRNDKAFYCLKS